jgi:hypothetical protein
VLKPFVRASPTPGRRDAGREKLHLRLRVFADGPAHGGDATSTVQMLFQRTAICAFDEAPELQDAYATELGSHD